MAHHHSFLLITGSVGYDWLVRPGLLGRTAGRAILEEETALHLHQVRCLPACLEPQTLLAPLGPWSAGLGKEQQACSRHLPGGWGCCRGLCRRGLEGLGDPSMGCGRARRRQDPRGPAQG